MKSRSRFNCLTSAQNDIISHWQAAKGARELPRRSDIDPGRLRAHLSSISMVELDAKGDAWFRLVGSRLQAYLGPNAGGRNLREFGSVATSMWSLGLTAAAEHGRPTGGVVNRKTDRHAWLRLPLATGHSDRALILCHDVVLACDTPEEDDPFGLFSGGSDRLAA